jgi:hypothetical protein
MTLEEECDDLRTALTRLKYQLQGIKFELKLRRLGWAKKDGFDPRNLVTT